ncbi:hypothetical protein H257_14816 [Aphanomyces astaci]|uniref:Uncharacterized protein n=1 Tax=Aphanomyces astaci TaxID=112090 RepID=W4FR55_APHAT|nr:hypothetical protein H257_14816 [Aphanomyces astaci]ETV69441.1 hypothetical protein H257_14816 [Aphanomyces astaci]|eukprot:XP_009841014.1 hypothetical protein H257_14816 [Aphanomyces astaci]
MNAMSMITHVLDRCFLHHYYGSNPYKMYTSLNGSQLHVPASLVLAGTFVVRCQTPNSPDLNVLDLGYFASIQSLQNNVSELASQLQALPWGYKRQRATVDVEGDLVVVLGASMAVAAAADVEH